MGGGEDEEEGGGGDIGIGRPVLALGDLKFGPLPTKPRGTLRVSIAFAEWYKCTTT